MVRPMWSAALDPCVLFVRVVPPIDPQAHVFDRLPLGTRRLIGPDAEYLAFNQGGAPIRLDVVAGSTEAAPFSLRFDIADDADLDTRLLELQRFRARSGNARPHDRLAKQLLALKAIDAHEAGASLREVAALLLPSEEWPGDGEHRKSFVRRLIIKGRHLVRAGPACILRPKRITPGYR